MENIRRKYDSMVDLSKFTFNKKNINITINFVFKLYPNFYKFGYKY